MVLPVLIVFKGCCQISRVYAKVTFVKGLDFCSVMSQCRMPMVIRSTSKHSFGKRWLIFSYALGLNNNSISSVSKTCNQQIMIIILNPFQKIVFINNKTVQEVCTEFNIYFPFFKLLSSHQRVKRLGY